MATCSNLSPFILINDNKLVLCKQNIKMLQKSCRPVVLYLVYDFVPLNSVKRPPRSAKFDDVPEFAPKSCPIKNLEMMETEEDNSMTSTCSTECPDLYKEFDSISKESHQCSKCQASATKIKSQCDECSRHFAKDRPPCPKCQASIKRAKSQCDTCHGSKPKDKSLCGDCQDSVAKVKSRCEECSNPNAKDKPPCFKCQNSIKKTKSQCDVCQDSKPKDESFCGDCQDSDSNQGQQFDSQDDFDGFSLSSFVKERCDLENEKTKSCSLTSDSFLKSKDNFGAWITPQPIIVTNCLNEKINLFFVLVKDTEGPDVTRCTMAKLFTIISLTSSQIQLNSHCGINEGSVKQFSLFLKDFHNLKGKLGKKHCLRNVGFEKLCFPKMSWDINQFYPSCENRGNDKTIIWDILKEKCEVNYILSKMCLNVPSNLNDKITYKTLAKRNFMDLSNDHMEMVKSIPPKTIEGRRLTGQEFATLFEKLVKLSNKQHSIYEDQLEKSKIIQAIIRILRKIKRMFKLC